jgi:IPT/TIG domain
MSEGLRRTLRVGLAASALAAGVMIPGGSTAPPAAASAAGRALAACHRRQQPLHRRRPPAVISRISPPAGRVGSTVTIRGCNLADTVSVSFSGTHAAFTVRSDNRLTTTVPAGASSGPIVVITLAGRAAARLTRTGESPSFTVIRLHFTVNVGADTAAAASLGFNLLDVAGSTSDPREVIAAVDALPPGTMALVWVGNLDNAPPGDPCPAPDFSYAQFAAQVDALKANPRVYGYYLADEPHPAVCPNAAADIRARADYIHARAPHQKAFILVQDGSDACGADLGCEYRTLRPARTDVDLVGLDPYPCHYDDSGNPVPCDDTAIVTALDAALAAGIPASAVVPVFQAFGQQGRTDGGAAYYRMPSASELASLLSIWRSVLPEPAFDYFYTYGVQCGPGSCSAPQAIANTPDVQTVVAAHNAQ